MSERVKCPLCEGYGSYSKMIEAGAGTNVTGARPVFDTCPRCEGTGDLNQYDWEKAREKFLKTHDANE